MNSIAEQGRDGVSKGREGVSSSGRSEQQTGIMNQSMLLSAGGVHIRWWCVCVCGWLCVRRRRKPTGDERLPRLCMLGDVRWLRPTVHRKLLAARARDEYSPGKARSDGLLLLKDVEKIIVAEGNNVRKQHSI